MGRGNVGALWPATGPPQNSHITFAVIYKDLPYFQSVQLLRSNYFFILKSYKIFWEPIMTTHQVILIFIPAITWFSFNQQMLDIVSAPLSMFSLGRQIFRWCYRQYSSRWTNNVHIKDPANTPGWAQHATPQTNCLWKWTVLLIGWENKWNNMVPRLSWVLKQKTFITPDTFQYQTLSKIPTAEVQHPMN